MDRDELIWAAGLFEGEGCISNPSYVSRIQLIVQMNDEDVVRRFHRAVDGLGTVVSVPARKEHWQSGWRWIASHRKDVARILCAIAPNLGARRRAKALEAAETLHARHLNRVAKGFKVF